VQKQTASLQHVERPMVQVAKFKKMSFLAKAIRISDLKLRNPRTRP